MHSMKKCIVSLTMVGALAASFAIAPVQPVFADETGSQVQDNKDKGNPVKVQFPTLKTGANSYSVFISGLKKRQCGSGLFKTPR